MKTTTGTCRSTNGQWQAITATILAMIGTALMATSVIAQPLPLPQIRLPQVPRPNPQAVPVAENEGGVSSLKYPHPGMAAILNDGKQQAGRNATATDEQIAKWVRDLDANEFATRKLASAELAEVGKRVVPVLIQEMVERNSLEQRHRGIQILEAMAKSKYIDDEAAAFDGLRELARMDRRSLKMRANRSLESIKEAYNGRAIERLVAKGASLDHNYLYGAAQNINFIQGRVVPGQIVTSSNGGNRLIFDDRWNGDASDLEMLAFITGITQVELEGQKINDEFLTAVSQYKTLRSVKIRKANITDAGIAKLEGLPELDYIDVRYTKITDVSLPVFASFKLARYVRLFGTGIAPDKQKYLNEKLPNSIVIDIRQGGFLGVGPRLRGEDTPCIITRPEPNSAAERAGLIDGDIVLQYDNKPTKTFDELREHIGVNAPGDEIKLTILRGKNKKEMTVVLGEWTSKY